MSFPFHPELAYIGPGAGFAFLGSFVSILGGVLLGLDQLLLWPVRMACGARSPGGRDTSTPRSKG